ncbi:TadE/TadG family type IV pilus assembly protein [Roseateles sp.]|uniref:TadE/TadG family type IV pilus assembly protein n=1 Tax=Roseateles sp. TaxID=1971397 RepID=UPI003D138734
MKRRPPRPAPALARQQGASIVETMLVLPTLLFLVLAIWQAALGYHAKNSLNYASFEAARAGSVSNAKLSSIHAAFQKAMLPYYGGGRSLAELADTAAKAAKDLDAAALRIEIISPTPESFRDYNSPALQAALKTGEPVLPNVGLDELSCPRDVPGCQKDPKTNASGQTLLDANLLKLRVTYGIPPSKQMPMLGKFYTWALGKLGAGSGDAFKLALIKAGRIPVVSHAVVRMQSDAIRNSAMVSSPGPGNDGTPTDPGPGPVTPPLPTCPWWDPACSICTEGSGQGACEIPPETCPGG